MRHVAENVSVSLFPIMPPAREIGNRCCSGIDHGDHNNSEALQEKLSAAWVALHEPHTHESAPPILPVPPDRKSLNHMTACQKAGQCLCSEGRRATREFRAALASAVKKLCSKGSPGRKLYDSGRLVLRLAAAAADGCAPRVKWFFIGFGNLLESVFTVKPLQPAGQDPRLRGLPQVPDDPLLLSAAGAPSDLVVVADLMLPAASCTLELCGLVVDSDIMFPHFVPLASVRRGEPGVSFWPPQVGRRGGGGNRLLRIHARNLPAGGRGRGRGGGTGQPAICDVRDDDVGDVTAGDGCVLDVLQDEVYSEAGDVAPWAFDDSSESESSDSESEEGGRRAPPPPPAATPPPPPAAAAPRPRAPGVAHRDYSVDWPKMLHSTNSEGQHSYLRVSQAHGARFMDMRALCSYHQPRCQFSSTCGQGRRPVGRLWAWLNAAEDFSSKLAHRRYVPPYPERVLARDEFEMLPGNEDWLVSETGGVGLPEPVETWTTYS